MNLWKTLLALLILNGACQTNQDKAFQHYFTNFQHAVDEQHLMHAFLTGQLSFDSLIITMEPNEVDSIADYVNTQLAMLSGFSTERLSPELHLHHQRTKDFLTLLNKQLNIEQPHRYNPGFYDPRPRLNFLLEKGSIAEWKTALHKLSQNYQSATEFLLPDTAQTPASATQQGITVYRLLSDEIQRKGKTLPGSPQEKKALSAELEKAILATKSFIGYANSLAFERLDNIKREAAFTGK